MTVYMDLVFYPIYAHVILGIMDLPVSNVCKYVFICNIYLFIYLFCKVYVLRVFMVLAIMMVFAIVVNIGMAPLVINVYYLFSNIIIIFSFIYIYLFSMA